MGKMLTSALFLPRILRRVSPRIPTWLRRHALSTTYYDSQSGTHIPVRDDREIAVHVPARPADDRTLWQTLRALERAGVRGAVLPAGPPPSDTPPGSPPLRGMTVFLPRPSGPPPGPASYGGAAISLVVEGEGESAGTDLARLAATGAGTTIALRPSAVCDGDPVMVAAAAATLIDSTGGGDYIWIGADPHGGGADADIMRRRATVVDVDDAIRLIEELSYLDVVGPTMKSRLIVDVGLAGEAGGEELVEECVGMGVANFSVERDRIRWLADIAKRHGKCCGIVCDD